MTNTAQTAHSLYQNSETTQSIYRDVNEIKEFVANASSSPWRDAPGYASGTKHAKAGLAQVWEDGPEIITTAKGTFIPFEGGEGVVPAAQTERLIKLANAMENGGLKLQMPDMSNYAIPNLSNTVNNNQNQIVFNIQIEGNADSNTVSQFKEATKEIADNLIKDKRFQEGVTNFVNRRQAADRRMAGGRISMK